MVAAGMEPHPGRASLPMYPFAEIRPSYDALWAAFAAHMAPGAVPTALSHDLECHGLWHDPQLVLSQACGWPIVDELRGVVRTIGAFSYAVPSARGPYYRSRIVMHRERTRRTDPTALTAALNEFASLSGWLSLVGAFPELGGQWTGGVLKTGAHIFSLAALAAGAADIAAIDAVTYVLLQRDRPHLLADLVVVDEGPLIPCLPLIVAGSATDAEITTFRSAFRHALDDLSATDRDALLITGFHDLDERDYEHLTELAVRY